MHQLNRPKTCELNLVIETTFQKALLLRQQLRLRWRLSETTSDVPLLQCSLPNTLLVFLWGSTLRHTAAASTRPCVFGGDGPLL
mmetsp:Transcript_21090/g.58569  ORF Transcript_21090/g.58569 Transcript_21090/m.58569 type:complete len:84 (-) Transcript_21090:366-617(-)